MYEIILIMMLLYLIVGIILILSGVVSAFGVIILTPIIASILMYILNEIDK